MVNKIVAMLSLVLLLLPGFVMAGSGAIWTTMNDCGDLRQDVNHYNIGDIVYVNGEKFDAGSYNWSLTGLPGGASCTPGEVVARGLVNVDGTGKFCFAAHEIAAEECGEYKAEVAGKHDNYRVDVPVVPEFGILAGALTIVSAVAAFLIIRKH